ncbi:hypothetical protein Vadar_005622 [Vaccinium darrowii]|uniref:Uncharacterized protein n=1 Tax=Vaccinium darrowii TaxID=229202 RepID=A0ACB7YJZ5_9ERIC|nr:hypothetical protein Vadar_005622 [Vaccinium darrowii]
MAISTESLVYLCICVVVSSLRSVSSASMPVCPLQSASFLNNLQSECSISFTPNPSLEVNGYLLDRRLALRGVGYRAVLFYAPWCPFSHDVRLMFEALSSMFPEIKHLAVEQSSVMPSVLSQYGVHSFPAVLMMNQTSIMRFRDSKDLHSLLKFYKKITGYEPVHYVSVDQFTRLESSGKLFAIQSRKGSALSGILSREPYLLFSLMFFFVRIVVFLFPKVVSQCRAFWVSYAPHFNLEIFGETSQIMGRVRLMIDVKRIWAKLRLWKTRNLRESARNARVWASSLASSVS